ncbi:MAG: class I SAM-dependent methyltransferase [Bacteroidetes bacterium]|nr:class I SAM-dependent methyltransferase [Bacteroidota bacterium]
MYRHCLLESPPWKDYELLDCGNFEKLERFGSYILIRPEPQAIWDRAMDNKEWLSIAHARYTAKTSTSGEWEKFQKMPANWVIKYKGNGFTISFGLKFTAFKHLGVFPEQAANWEYLYTYLQQLRKPDAKVLNLFSYTGGASLAAKAGKADVVHLDSVKGVVNWAKENMELSGLDNIRWVVEDAAKFAEREAKRGNTYNAIIMDPPSYGLGPKGERWKLEDNLNDMMKNVLSLLDKDNFCFIINTYSLNLSPLVLKNLFQSILPVKTDMEFGELYTKSTQGHQLPLGSFLRCKKI